MVPLHRLVAERLAPLLQRDASEIQGQLVRPPNPEMGDLGFACFALAKEKRRPPVEIAAALAADIDATPPFAAVRAVGPYINFTFAPAALAEATASAILADPNAWGRSSAGNGRTVVIDYSSPNLAKPLAIHHLRTNVIGAALMRMYEAAGWRVLTVNHLGDWGTTFGQLMVSYKRAQAANPDMGVDADELLRLYVQYHAQADGEEDADEEARLWFRKLEASDPEAVRLWKLFVDVSMKPLHAVYERLGLTFDCFLGESFYNDKMPGTIERLDSAGLLQESEGARIVDLADYDMPPCLICKRDGATTYATRDLAAAEYRQREFAFDKCLYVVANQQELHFRQVFKVLELMGHAWAEGCEHVKFGMLSLGPGVFDDVTDGQAVTASTRKGRVVFLEEVLDRAVDKARDIILENAREDAVRDQADALAEQVGVGAVVFSEYMQRRMRDIVFTWEKILNLQGDSGPYLQYTHARLSSVRRRYGKPLPDTIDWTRLASPVEREILLTLSGFPGAIQQAVSDNEPSVVATYLLDLCAAFNRMFTDKERHRIVGPDEDLSAARVGLVEAVRLTLARGLGLLGLHAPDRM